MQSLFEIKCKFTDLISRFQTNFFNLKTNIFNIPNLFTASNMLCGILAILLSISGRIDLAPYAIFAGAIFDFFDGFLARLFKQQSELGKQLDSLADMITFGLAPGIFMLVLLVFVQEGSVFHENARFDAQIIYSWLTDLSKFQISSFVPLIALFIPFMSMFRLAKFNIDTRQSVSFIGLPTPANTIFFTAFPLILSQVSDASSIQLSWIQLVFQPMVLIPIIVIMSLLLVAEIPLFAMKFKQFSWKGNEIRYSFLITCLILIPILLVWSIPIIVLLYIVLSIVENLFFKKKQNEIQS